MVYKDTNLTNQSSNINSYKVHSLEISPNSNPCNGSVRYDSIKSIWNGGILLISLILAPMFFSWGGFFIFLVSFQITVLLGWSLGMHRKLIHRSFKCKLWLERLLVYFGVLFGMQGPFGIILAHDLRDWAQREPQYHPFLCHKAGLITDFWWTHHCRLLLTNPPIFNPGQLISNDRFYKFLQKTWMLQQLPLMLLFYLFGGWSWLVWGSLVRIAIGVHGHWFVGYLCHQDGQRDWHTKNAAIQGANIPAAAIVSMGECYHNNHHAFPTSAKMGLFNGQLDLGYRCLLLLEKAGIVNDIQTPHTLPKRIEIKPQSQRAKSFYNSLN